MAAFRNKDNGSWYVQFRYTDWRGERKQKLKRGFATKKEALAWEREFLMQKQADVGMTFESFVKLYERDMKPKLKLNTWLSKEHIIKTKILPYFKNRILSEITALDVMEWQNEMRTLTTSTGKPYSQDYLENIHTQLSCLFNHAVKYYGLQINPAAKAGGMGGEEKKEMLFWTKDEYLKFAEAMMDKLALYYAFELLYWCGIREGELLALTPADFDFSRKTLRIKMFGVEDVGNLHFAINAKQLGNGLDAQLEKFVREHPDTRLIIIDTLQKVRELSGDAYSYRDDYQIIGQLKQLADKFKLCMLVVHHTRKSPANDEFERISGTTGIYGCADGAFVLSKEKRTDSAATLSISGRDQPDQCLHLVRDEETLQWNFDHADTELYKEPPDPLLEKVAALVTEERPTWQGSATELIAATGCEIQPNALTKLLNVNASKLLCDYQIRYTNAHTKTGSRITLTLQR